MYSRNKPSTFSSGSEGGVSSVDISVPSTELVVTGNPITTSGTISLSWVSQSQRLFFASPYSASGVPGFRSIQTNDLPNSGVTASTYSNATITVDVKGRVINAISGMFVIDGGTPGEVYGGTVSFDGGTP